MKRNIDYAFKILKRYSLQSKFELCFRYSIPLFSTGGHYNVNSCPILPWEIEIFATIAALTENEYRQEDLCSKKGQKAFLEIMSIIRKTPEFDCYIYSGEKREKFFAYMSLSMLQQLESQKIFLLRYYRYQQIFSTVNADIDLPQIFFDHFGTDYQSFLDLSYTLYVAILLIEADSNQSTSQPQNSMFKRICKHIQKKYKIAFSHLVTSRKSLIEKNKLKKNDDIYFSLKLFHQTPFVKENDDIYFPLPHVIVSATTDSLLYRLTEGNNALREQIGKHILEGYLFDLLRRGEIYDEVLKEVKYSIGKNLWNSPDVMIRNKKYFLFLDSKSLVPSMKSRLSIENKTKEEFKRTVDYLVKLYNQINNFPISFNPFSDKQEYIDSDDVFGIIVLLEDHYIMRDSIFEEAAQKLKMDLNSDDFKYFCSNFRIFSLYEIERIFATGENIVELLIESKNNPKSWFDFTLQTQEKKSRIVELEKFEKNLFKDACYNLIEEFGMSAEMQEQLVDFFENNRE